MRSLSSITKEIFKPSQEADIPSPIDVAVMAKKWLVANTSEINFHVPSPREAFMQAKSYVMQQRAAFIAYTIEVKAAQRAFQDAIQEAGLDKISSMTTKEVLKTYGTRPDLH